jgi:hypothetical protein
VLRVVEYGTRIKGQNPRVEAVGEHKGIEAVRKEALSRFFQARFALAPAMAILSLPASYPNGRMACLVDVGSCYKVTGE